MSLSCAHDGFSRPAGLVDAAGGSEGPQGVHLVHDVVVAGPVVVHNLHLEADGALGENIHWSPDNVAHNVMISVVTGYRGWASERVFTDRFHY